jgi:hypothetical protein
MLIYGTTAMPQVLFPTIPDGSLTNECHEVGLHIFFVPSV